MRVFISHSSKDAALAGEVCSHIEAGGHSCFLAPRDIRSGYEYAEEIINGIDGADVILLLLSEAANSSPHVLREIERAVSKKKSIIVYKLEEVTLSKSMEYFLMTHQWLNAKTGGGFEEIMKCINDFAPSVEDHAEDTQEQDNSAPAAPSIEIASQKSEERGGRKKTMLTVFIAAVIVAALAVITFNLVRSKNDGDSQPDTASTTESAEPDDGASLSESSPTSDAVEKTAEESVPQSANSAEEQPESVPQPEPETEPAAPALTVAPAATEEAEVILPADTQTESLGEQQPAVQGSPVQAELGDTITFGTYYGEPVEWRVIRISEDKTQAVVIADDILTMKAYDAAEGGDFNSCDGKDYWNVKPEEIDPEIQRLIRGDNRWELSNIRTWLNSEKEIVEYKDQPPITQAMAERRNGYHTEAGFLNGFTKDELAAVLPTKVTTNGTVTEDRVFLLSTDEIQWLYEADVSIYAKPTQAAVDNDKSQWYTVNISAYNVDDHYWWLRDANPDTSCEVYYVNISYSDQMTASDSAGLEGYGVRPALTLDLTSDIVKAALES